MIVALDVDEVCANLHDAWLHDYNRISGDRLLSENVLSWDIQKFVKKGWEHRIFELLHDPTLYERVTPMTYARTAVYELLAMGHRVVYVSSCIPGTEGHKREWLVRWGFLTPATKGKDFVAMTDKSLIAADFLFDDRVDNLVGFKGVGVLVDRPHNGGVSWGRRVTAVRHIPGFVRSCT
ncbi:5' nucleotidase [Caudoviricetes sp.]|nr:5' nucleotidase [Caudoviricetes sp.]